MDTIRIPKAGEFYRHFKNKLYQIITVATHSETGESMVVYQALYGDYKTYVRPLVMFISKVDKTKYPEVSAVYRFEKVNLSTDHTLVNETEEKSGTNDKNKIVLNSDIVEPEETKYHNEINPILIEFLEARTYDEKLSIIISNKKDITDKLINDFAASIDCTVEEGPIEERINGFVFCLQTLAKFETRRLR